MCRISKSLLRTLNYNYSYIKDGGIIKKFVFTEDTTVDEAKDFLSHYFPDVDFDTLEDVPNNTPEYIRVEWCGDEDYEFDFEDGYYNPLYNKDTHNFKATINLRTGEVVDFDDNNIITGYHFKDIDNFKIVDEGTYSLLDKDMRVICSYRGYVPNGVLPPNDGYGDYITLILNGKYITNLYPYDEMNFHHDFGYYCDGYDDDYECNEDY